MNHEVLIEKYFQNKLSKKELVAFSDLMKTDASFRDAVEFQSDLKRSIEHSEDERFRKFVAELEEKQPHNDRPSRIKYWLVAAGAAILLGISFFLSQSSHQNSRDLYAAYFKPYRNVIVPVERGNVKNNLQDDAFYAYENADYRVSDSLFVQLYDQTKAPYLLFYRAISLMELGRPEAAIPLLEQHLETDDTLTDKTHWYLALAYLESGNTQKARFHLQKQIAQGSFNVTESKKLLQQLD